MKLLIASNNSHKVREIKEILGSYFEDISTLKEAGIDIDVVEDGTTFEENALKKAEEVLKVATSFDAALADDSGLCVDALDGAPGIYSARYAGEGHNDEENIQKLLMNLKDVDDSKRTARFVCCIALVRRNASPLVAEGTVEGLILHEKRGNDGFGYDPIFLYEPANQTFAELSGEEKNSISHRHNALEKLKELLS